MDFFCRVDEGDQHSRRRDLVPKSQSKLSVMGLTKVASVFQTIPHVPEAKPAIRMISALLSRLANITALVALCRSVPRT